MTTIKDAPIVELLIGTEKFPISDGSGKPVTATIQLIIDKCGIPLVEELDSDASLGTLVRYKLDISIDKIETVNKTCSIRDLTYRELDPQDDLDYIIKGDIITKINFLMPNIENIPSKFKLDECYIEFIICSNTEWFCIGLVYSLDSFLIFGSNKSGLGPLMINNQIYLEGMLQFENFFNNSKIYYSGIFSYPDRPISIEECFDLLDYFITVDTVKEIKTTEEITKVVPYIKQQHGWESLITENSDFNNDFNLDFN